MRYAKSLTAAAVAGLTALGTALTDGGVTPAEWTGVAIATLGALGAVYAIPNSQPADDYDIPAVD
jgi:hypothetical protein